MRWTIAAVALAVGGCSLEPDGVMLDHGMWHTRTHFSTPKVDGLSVDALRKSLPADEEKTECATPQVRQGDGLLRAMNMRRDICSMGSATTANGQISGEGTCPGLAKKLAETGSSLANETLKTDSWIKVNGQYNPRYVTLDADLFATMQQPSGATSRLTLTATHSAERVGECG